MALAAARIFKTLTPARGSLFGMSSIANLSTVVLDCVNPASLAEFYTKVTGWKVTYSDEDCVYLSDGGPIQLGFQRVADYQPQKWPDPAKHAHFDFKVSDIDQSVRELVALGASKPDFQPGGDQWTVLADPEGHLFCVAA